MKQLDQKLLFLGNQVKIRSIFDWLPQWRSGTRGEKNGVRASAV